ncbi:MAG: DNA repair protein RecO [Chthoniobacterales bacterium]
MEGRTSGFLLRRFRFSESSFIIVWLKRDFGKIKKSASGVLKAKSRFAGAVDIFYLSEINVLKSPKASGEIWNLCDESLERSFAGCERVRYLACSVAAYFSSLLDATTHIEEPCGELFDLLDRALRYLDGNVPDMPAVRHFEKELCRGLGLGLAGGEVPHQVLMDYTGKALAGRKEIVEQLKNR